VDLTDFWNTKMAYSLSDLYGSDGSTIASSAFCWANRMYLNYNFPNAAASGTIYKGFFPISAWW
jgi:hypothetical protein